MLGSAHLAAFAATAQPDRARQFYQGTLGLHLVSEDEFALAFDANGTMLRIQKVTVVHPAAYTLLGWRVPNISEVVMALSTRGVSFERYSFMEQDALGIWSAPGGARIAWFKDPDGNILSLAEHPTG